jgi:hypothetical protein
MHPFTLALLGSSAASAVGGLLGSRASGQAAQAQSQAAMMSAITQAQQAQAAREQLQQSQATGAGAIGDYYSRGAAAYAPYQRFGEEATNRYATLMGLRPGVGSGSLMEQPTLAQLKFDPGYEFRFSQGMRGVNASAAANAGLQSGAALKAAARFGAGEASQEYGNAYARFMQNRQNQIAMLQGGVGTGLTAGGGAADLAGRTGLGLSSLYSGTGANLANTALGAGQSIGQGLENAAAARASGYMGGATALQSALQAPAQNYMLYSMMNQFAPQKTQYAGYQYGAPQMASGFTPGFMGAPTIG